MRDNARQLTEELVTDGRIPVTPVISPDGRWVAFGIVTVGQTPELPTDELWIATVDGTARPRKLTTGSAPRWTSDSAWIYFLSDRLDNGTSQLQRIRPVGGDVEALTA